MFLNLWCASDVLLVEKNNFAFVLINLQSCVATFFISAIYYMESCEIASFYSIILEDLPFACWEFFSWYFIECRDIDKDINFNANYPHNKT